MAIDAAEQLRDQLRSERAMRQKLESEHNRLVKAQNESSKELQQLTQITLEQKRSIQILERKIEEMERNETALRRQVAEKAAEMKNNKAADVILRKEVAAIEHERARSKKLELLCRQYEHDLELYRREIECLQQGNKQTMSALRASEDELLGARYALQGIGSSLHGSDAGIARRISDIPNPSPTRHSSKRLLSDTFSGRASSTAYHHNRAIPSSGRQSPPSPMGASVVSNRSRLSARSGGSNRRSRSYDRQPVDRPRTPHRQRISTATGKPSSPNRSHTSSPSRSHAVSPVRSARVASDVSITSARQQYYSPHQSPARSVLSPERSARSARSPQRANALDPRNRSHSSERFAPGDIIKVDRMLSELTPKKHQ